MMRLGGHQARAIAYMMGNNMIVETMFRHGAGVVLYAPMRTAITKATTVAFTSASTNPPSRFVSFGDSRIPGTGRLLDAKLAALLRLIPLPVPAELEVDA